MADYNSSLPIRTQNAGDAIVKIADATVTSQQLAVEADGSINVNAVFAPGGAVEITDGTDTLQINADGSINSVVTATNLDIRDLVFATDKVDASGSTLGANSGVDIGDVTINNAAGASAVNIQDGGNSITVDGSVTVSATNLDIRDLVFATDKVDVSGSTLGANSGVDIGDVTINNAAGASAVNIQDGGNSITVDATDLDIRNLSASQDNVAISDGTDTLQVNTDGSINVRISQLTGTTSVADYNTSAALAGNSTNTHTYTSTGNFYLEQIEAAASGKMKIVVAVNGTTRFVQFNSTANPNMSILLQQPILATTGQTVTIARTNLENQSQDVYSTIVGYLA